MTRFKGCSRWCTKENSVKIINATKLREAILKLSGYYCRGMSKIKSISMNFTKQGCSCNLRCHCVIWKRLLSVLSNNSQRNSLLSLPSGVSLANPYHTLSKQSLQNVLSDTHKWLQHVTVLHHSLWKRAWCNVRKQIAHNDFVSHTFNYRMN